MKKRELIKKLMVKGKNEKETDENLNDEFGLLVYKQHTINKRMQRAKTCDDNVKNKARRKG